MLLIVHSDPPHDLNCSLVNFKETAVERADFTLQLWMFVSLGGECSVMSPSLVHTPIE